MPPPAVPEDGGVGVPDERAPDEDRPGQGERIGAVHVHAGQEEVAGVTGPQREAGRGGEHDEPTQHTRERCALDTAQDAERNRGRRGGRHGEWECPVAVPEGPADGVGGREQQRWHRAVDEAASPTEPVQE